MDTTTRGDLVPQNSSTITNLKEGSHKSETKSKGSFGNAGQFFGKLFKKKEKEDEVNR